MKYLHALLLQAFLGLLFCTALAATIPKAGFFLPDSVHEMTLRYRTAANLIVLPVLINDSVEVNLILDTGCRNLILFGKKFKNIFPINSGKEIKFSGLGDGKQVTGLLSLGNKVSIKQVLGEHIPIVIVDNKNVFSSYRNIHGVIGYDIFLKFEIELNARENLITFRPAFKSKIPPGYTQISMQVVDAKPMMNSEIIVSKKIRRAYDLMIDTGSSLGLLLKTTDISVFEHFRNENVLGIGFNGPIRGYETVSDQLSISGFEINSVPTGIVSSLYHNNGSIGMEVLKNYIVILNYCKSYACFKPNTA